MKTERAVAFGLVWALAASFVGCGGRTQARSVTAAPAAASAPAFDHAPFDEILRAHAHAGQVDYRSLKAEAEDKLQRYLRMLAAADPTQFPERDDQLAFWLNAYNAFVIAGVIERYPGIESVMDAPDFFKQKRWTVGGQRRSLNEIENEIIRPTFKDPRIHFILVCAARSCPPLQAKAMKAETLQADLERATRAVINDTAYVRPDPEAKVLHLTRIMSWYKQDFVAKDGSLEAFLARYLDEPARRLVQDGRLTIAFMEYDWALNDAGASATE